MQNNNKSPVIFVINHFTEKVRLKHHIKSIHNGESFECNICNKTFTQKVI